MSELIFAGLVLSGAWTQLDEIGWIGWAALAVVAAFDFLGLRLQWPRLSWPVVAGDRAAAIAATALCALVFAHLTLTFREEFGFSGDEGYHLSATRAFALYFMRAGPILVLIVGTFVVLVFRRFRYASTVGVAALLAASYALPASALFGRYPTAFYLLATPLNVVFDLIGSPYRYSANHVMNTLSVPVWLFVLRPLIIGRWPDWRVLPVALVVYFQSSALVYLSSQLLEPWAIVFALLAMEALVALDPDRRWIAVPLCLAAICFKETMVLLLPTVWLLACVEWRGWRPTVRPGSIALGIAVAIPFLIYFEVRTLLAMPRGSAISEAGTPVWVQVRLVDWFTFVRAQLGLGSIVVALAAIALTITAAPLWIATALAIALFFFADPISVPWTGYARFVAYSWLAVCGAVFVVIYRRDLARRSLVAICAVIAIAQLPATLTTFALDFGADHERNSLEWHDALIRVPIRSLALRIPGTPGGDQVRRLRVTAPGIDKTSLAVAYPDVARRYAFTSDALNCRCTANDEAVIGVFAWPANLGDSMTARLNYKQTSDGCVAQVESTCASTIVERDRSGAPVGVLGVGRR